jgi:Flp pilus assembly protein TadG
MLAQTDRTRGRAGLLNFIRAENGSTTIEFMLIVPLITTLVLLVTDTSLLFLRQSTLLNISRDTARAVSRHMMTPAEAKAYAEAVAKTARSSPTATVTINNGAVTVEMVADARSSAPFGIVSYAVGDKIYAYANNVMEPM